MDFFPNGYFPDGYYPDGYFGGGAASTPSSPAVPLWALIAGGISSGVILPVGDSLPPKRVYLTAGDTGGTLLYTITDTTGDPVPISDSATVKLLLKVRGSATLATPRTGGVFKGALGMVSFTFTSESPVPAAGDYVMQWEVAGVSYPFGHTIPVTIQESLD